MRLALASEMASETCPKCVRRNVRNAASAYYYVIQTGVVRSAKTDFGHNSAKGGQRAPALKACALAGQR
jgi:hypothetical protein